MTLNLEPESTPAKKNKNYKKALRVGSVVSLVGIGSTFAANISLNQGDNVEFGQGVAQTAACDEDGFSITPVSSYDNARSIFRLDRVQVSGLNLTPVGTGWNDSDLNGVYADQAAAKTAHPGQYYDTTADAWKRTCDGVVLDFKAYTDNTDFAGYTLDAYTNSGNTSISSPIGWSQYNGQPLANSTNNGFAIKFDTYDDTYEVDTSYGVNNANGAGFLNTPIWIYADNGGQEVDFQTPADSNFSMYFNDNWAPKADTISKIAIASMSDFPSDYITDDYYI
jgi:hypothetical protein